MIDSTTKAGKIDSTDPAAHAAEFATKVQELTVAWVNFAQGEALKRYHAMLRKLDGDSGVPLTTYYANGNATLDNFVAKFAVVLAQLDTDVLTGSNYAAVIGKVTLATMTAKINALLAKLDGDTIVGDTNYVELLAVTAETDVRTINGA